MRFCLRIIYRWRGRRAMQRELKAMLAHVPPPIDVISPEQRRKQLDAIARMG